MGEFEGPGEPRIFQIGFNRCGTTSIHLFFQGNGLKSIHWGRGSIAAGIEAARMEGKPLLHYVDGFQVYCDMEFMREDHAGSQISKLPFEKLYQNIGSSRMDRPIYAYKHFRELDRQYPGSKFILNTREIENWIHSRRVFLDIGYEFCDHGDRIHGSQDELGDCWREHWNDHVDSVRSHFTGRPDDLLEFDIERDGPEKIVEFFSEHSLDPRHWGRHNSSDGEKIRITEIDWPEYS